MKTLLRNVFFFLLLFILSLKLQAQSDSIIFESCIQYEWGDPVDTTLAVDSFDVATGLIHSHTEENYWTSYSYNQNNLCDTSFSHFTIMGDYRTIILYTTFLKDSISVTEIFDSLTWTMTGQYNYAYDSLQRLFSVAELTFNGDTLKTTYYSYSGNNIDSIFVITPAPDTALQLYTYDTSGSYTITYYHWEDGVWDTVANGDPYYTNYNSQGQVVSSYDGWAWVQNYYDSLGRLIGSSGVDPHDGGSYWNYNYIWGCNGFLNSIDYSYYSDHSDYGSHCEYYYPGVRQFYIHLNQGYEICFGDTAHLRDSIILGAAPFTYAWTPSAGLSSDTVLSPDAFPDSTTTYYLTATDSAGDIFQDCVTITVHPVPQIAIYTLDSTAICYGDTIELFASMTGPPDAVIRWYRGNYNILNVDSVLHVSQSGIYTATVSTAFGCMDYADDTIDVNVSQASHLDVVISFNNHSCTGDTAFFKVVPLNSPFNNYQWYVDSLIIPGATDSVYSTTQAGTYQLTVTCDTSVCTWTSNPYTITFSTPPTPDIFPTIDTMVCPGNQNFTLRTTRDSSWGYAYLLNDTLHNWPYWMGDSIRITITGPSVIQVVAYNWSCPGYSDSIMVDVFPHTVFNILTSTNPPYCEDDSVLLSSSEAGIDYLWSTQETDSVIYVDTSGYYSVRLTDMNGCYSYSLVNLTFNTSPPVPVISYNGTELVSDTAFSMQWYLDGVAIAGATDSVYVPVQDGFYSYEIGNVSGCYAMSQPFYFSEVGIQTTDQFKNVFIKPTLTQNWFELINPYAVASSCRFEILSSTGELVFTKQITDEKTSMQLGTLKPGMYFWKVYAQNGEMVGAGKMVFVE